MNRVLEPRPRAFPRGARALESIVSEGSRAIAKLIDPDRSFGMELYARALRPEVSSKEIERLLMAALVTNFKPTSGLSGVDGFTDFMKSVWDAITGSKVGTAIIRYGAPLVTGIATTVATGNPATGAAASSATRLVAESLLQKTTDSIAGAITGGTVAQIEEANRKVSDAAKRAADMVASAVSSSIRSPVVPAIPTIPEIPSRMPIPSERTVEGLSWPLIVLLGVAGVIAIVAVVGGPKRR